MTRQFSTVGRLLLMALFAASTTLVAENYTLGQEAVWHEQRFQHKEEPRGGGGEVLWRDSFKKDGYQIYDFVIELHSVRGGGSEFASYTTDGVLKVFAAETGIRFDAAAKQYTERLRQRESTAPYIRIFNDKTIIVQGKTTYGTFLGDAGGNVEYTIHGLFVRNANLVGASGRFAFGGFTTLAIPATRTKVDENLREALRNSNGQPPTENPPAQPDNTPGRIYRTELSEFIFLQNGVVTEKRFNGPSSTFRVQGVGPGYVELFDSDRQLFVRLTNDRGLVRPANGNKWFTWPGSAGGWVTAPQPANRSIVFPSGGRVRKQADGSWIETGMDGRFVCRFRQLHQDASVIVLRDDNRRLTLTIPLGGGQILWQYDGQARGPWGNVRWE